MSLAGREGRGGADKDRESVCVCLWQVEIERVGKEGGGGI